ncbi:long-chain acyl-CoA synthetase [Stackebrandtia albiflava]|uniref:Acyl-CoA synthetase n=1 Tax=Stackebrandtia albiflava TaxID=406432 RepID=A0A562VGU6_9ACTN|nr:AMP-dependent synthetase/ligase [Stackebrandtia albiflava]TWJ17119.1 long-chain acyl-CoA synthetase [Stackebrandtia albiflava]
MREFAVPPAVEIPDDHNTTTALWDNAARNPDGLLFAVPAGSGWRDVTNRQFRDEVTAVAKGLAASGVKPGDRVGLMSRTRYEWSVLDYAIWTAGAVTVPIYDSSSAEQIRWILSDSGAVACITELPPHSRLVESVQDTIPTVTHTWEIEGGALDTLKAAGEGFDGDIEERRLSAKASDLATIVYTSGTTGRPKGCELTHLNLVADIANVLPSVSSMFNSSSTTLMFLPLAHVLARIIQVGCVQAEVQVGHISDRTQLVQTLPTFRPTFLVAVPRVFEKVYDGARQKAVDGGKGKIFEKAAQTAIDYSKSLDTGGPGLMLKLKHALFDKLVYVKLRTLMGGRCGSAISGGAPLGERLAHFFRGVGVTIYEGYGLTETSPVVSINLDDALRIGTVGRPTPGTSIRIADDGELLIKGPQIFKGYWNNPQATAESFDAEGWLKSGDIAEIDADGYLKITGRSKEIIVTAGGKNVAPAPLEDVVRAHPLVGQCLVVGDAKPFISALIALDHETLPAWLERHDRPADTPISELTEDPVIRAEIEAVVAEANATVSKAESIKKFRILPAALTEATGEVTPKQSVKRNVVLEKYAAEFEALYSS